MSENYFTKIDKTETKTSKDGSTDVAVTVLSFCCLGKFLYTNFLTFKL